MMGKPQKPYFPLSYVCEHPILTLVSNEYGIEKGCNTTKVGQNSMLIDTLEVVSQELGHFRPDITEIYLR